ncbi:hypothetical protein [Cryobacterium zhongshanensis]|uniref:hypothetical protein n=1 Tax=Cryobacterium zhongshanensis TaxID=2928153 RepID=UPI003559167F
MVVILVLYLLVPEVELIPRWPDPQSTRRTFGAVPQNDQRAGATMQGKVKADQGMRGHASAAMTLDTCADRFDDD